MSETKKLVILGGGAAGILIAIKLANTKGLDITLIDNKSFYEYTPGLCSVLYEKTEYDFQRHFNKITFDYAPFLSKRNIQFVLGRVKSLKDKKVYLFNDEHEPIIEYDYLVICTGSSYADPWKTLLTTNENEACLNSDARLEYLRQHRQKYLESNDILCIGAGPVGVELAAEIAHRSPQKKVTIVNSSEYVLSSAPAEIGKNAQKILEAKPSIRIISNEMASEVDATKDVYETNKTHTRFTPDLVYHCVGITPNTDFMESVWLNERKQIIVDEYLRIPGVEHVFAVGDVNSFDEPKMFYTAEMQAIHFVRNLRRIIMKHKELIPYHGSLPNMVISLGPHYGVGYLSGIRLTGWPFGQQKGSHLAAVTKKNLMEVDF
ncbi:uncharacterized protein BX663DRAFT_530691 [Cokeromyces recurvatus]|uniref:uncharacterized protein n=1 Tax=Cokeromyces recurvatus TaxID=90255 RepID=UPI00221E8978|nr:uncharacterized protein BX663DRAFT_530691 [Cokeromyces recurvatus]KAI7903461.1 hypothetical protein BX663DRAFT_530691 [Cokeromyces recurvatus]